MCQTNSAQQVLCDDSLSPTNSLCVNYKQKTCTLLGETGSRAQYCSKGSSVNAHSVIVTRAVFPDKNKQVPCRSNSFKAVCSPL